SSGSEKNAQRTIAKRRKYPRHRKIGQRRNECEIGRRQNNGDGNNTQRGTPIHNRAPGEVTKRQRAQHHRDKPRPGADAAAEIRKQIAAAEHLKSHQHAADEESISVNEHGGGLLAHLSAHFRLCASIALSVSTGAKSSVRTLASVLIASDEKSRRCASMG